MHMRMQQRARGNAPHSSSVNWDVFAAALPTGRGPAAQARRAELFQSIDAHQKGQVKFAELEPVLVKVLAPALHSTGVGDRRRKVRAAFDAARATAATVTKKRPGEHDQLELGEFRMVLVYLERYVELWDYFIAQGNSRDHRITMSEFVAAVPKLRDWGIEGIDAIESNPRQIFRQIDRDNTGFLLFHDFADWCARQDLVMYHERTKGLLDQISSDQLFDQVDINNDGNISRLEFSRGVRDGALCSPVVATPIGIRDGLRDQMPHSRSPQTSPMLRPPSSPQLPSPGDPSKLHALQSTMDQLAHSVQHLQQAMVGIVDQQIPLIADGLHPLQAITPGPLAGQPNSLVVRSKSAGTLSPYKGRDISGKDVGREPPDSYQQPSSYSPALRSSTPPRNAKARQLTPQARGRQTGSARNGAPIGAGNVMDQKGRSPRASLFSKFDLDGDGVVTREEFNKAVSSGVLKQPHSTRMRTRRSDADSDVSSVASWNPQDRPGPLIRAILAEDEKNSIALLSLDNCPEMNMRDRDSRSTLHLAASRGLADFCDALLSNTFFTRGDTKDTFEWTALHCAAMCGHTRVCKVLLEHYRFGESNAKDRIGDSALHVAAARGQVDPCMALLDHPRFTKVNAVNRNGWTALHSAASAGHTRVCQSILGHTRFQAAAMRNMFGGTALHCAARSGYAEACRALLDHGKFAEAARLKDCVGRTALHWAALNDHTETCLALIMHPSFTDLDVKDRHGQIALSLAKGQTKEAFVEARQAVRNRFDYPEDSYGRPEPFVEVRQGARTRHVFPQELESY